MLRGRLKPLGALLVAVALLGAAGASAAARPQPSWASLHRALRLKPLAGARCRASPLHAIARGRLRGVGAGPVYPTGMSPVGPDGRHPSWLASKTIWTWPTALKTHALRVLVRGIRLDGQDAVRFQLGPQWDTAPLTRELRIDTSQTVGAFSNSTWGTTVTLLFVRAAGCYGLQLDSQRGTSTIVVRATRP